MTSPTTPREHADRIQGAQARLIARIQRITNEAVATILATDSSEVEEHLKKLANNRLVFIADNEEFFGSIEFALVQLGIKQV